MLRHNKPCASAPTRVVLLLAAVMCVQCATSHVDSVSDWNTSIPGEDYSRIILGQKAPNNGAGYPGFVALVISIPFEQGRMEESKPSAPREVFSIYCGGSLIAKNAVLTALHCVKDLRKWHKYGKAVLKAVRGNIRLSSDGWGEFKSADEESYVKKIYMHKNYDSSSMENDIAIVILETAMSKPYTKIAKKVPPVGTEVMAIGFGKNNDFKLTNIVTNEVRMGWPNRLYEVPLTLGTFGKNCPTLYGGVTPTFPKKQMCVYGKLLKKGWQSICNGDSGGPLLNGKGETFGVTSWGPAEPELLCQGLLQFFNVYTNVPAYYETFIKPVLINPSKCTKCDLFTL